MALKKIGVKNLLNRASFKDVSIGFMRNPFTDDISSVSNENSIKQAVKNLILTVPGEKPFQPLVGSRCNFITF